MEPPQMKAGSPTSVTSKTKKGGFSLLSKASSTNGGGLRLNPFGRNNKKPQQQQQLQNNAPPPIHSVSFSDKNNNKRQDADSTGGNTDGNQTDNSRVSSLTDRDGLNAMAAAAMAAARRSNVAPRSVASSEVSSSDVSLNRGPPPPIMSRTRVMPQMIPPSQQRGAPPPSPQQRGAPPQLPQQRGAAPPPPPALRGANSSSKMNGGNVGLVPQLSRSNSKNPRELSIAPSNASSGRAVASRAMPPTPPSRKSPGAESTASQRRGPPPRSPRSVRREPPAAGEQESDVGSDENHLQQQQQQQQQKKIPFDKVKALLDRAGPPAGGSTDGSSVGGVLRDNTRQTINGRANGVNVGGMDDNTPRHTNVRDPSPVAATAAAAAAAATAAGIYVASSNVRNHSAPQRKPLEPGNMPVASRQEDASVGGNGATRAMGVIRPPTPPRPSNKNKIVPRNSNGNIQDGNFFPDDPSEHGILPRQQQRAVVPMRSDPPTSPPAVAREAVDPPDDNEDDNGAASNLDDMEDTISDVDWTTDGGSKNNDTDNKSKDVPQQKHVTTETKEGATKSSFDAGARKANVNEAEKKEEEAVPSPVAAVSLLVGDIGRQIQQSLDNVMDLEQVDQCLSPTSNEVKPTVSTAETKVVSNVATGDKVETDGPKVVAVDASPRGRSLQTPDAGKRRSRSMVAKGKGSIRERVMRQSGVSKSVDPKARTLPRKVAIKNTPNDSAAETDSSKDAPNKTRDSEKQLVKSSDNANDKDDSAEIRNRSRSESRSSSRRRKKSKTRLDVRASVNKKASAVAKRYAAKKETTHYDHSREITEENLAAAQRQQEEEEERERAKTQAKSKTKAKSTSKHYPDEISLSKYEVVSDLDQQSLRNDPVKKKKSRSSAKSVHSGAPKRHREHVPELVKSASSASSVLVDRYASIEQTPKVKVKNSRREGASSTESKAESHTESKTESKDENGILADEITEWSAPNNPDAEGVEMVFKTKENDATKKGGKDTTKETQVPEPSCAAACLSTLALDDGHGNATATNANDLTIDVGAGSLDQQDTAFEDFRTEGGSTQPKDDEPSMDERDIIQSQRSTDYLKQKLREKLRMHSLARNLSASSSQESQDEAKEKVINPSVERANRGLKIKTGSVKSEESSGNSSASLNPTKEKAMKKKRSRRRKDKLETTDVESKSSSEGTKTPIPNEDSSIPEDQIIEETKTGTSSQWTDIKTDGDQSYTVSQESPKSSISGSSKVRIRTKEGETTLLLTESVREKLRARAKAASGNSSDPIVLESVDSSEQSKEKSDNGDLIDLTAYENFEDMGIADEAVWLFDVSPKNSVDQELWQPRSTDMDSMMDFAAGMQNGNSDKYDLAEPGNQEGSPKSAKEETPLQDNNKVDENAAEDNDISTEEKDTAQDTSNSSQEQDADSSQDKDAVPKMEQKQSDVVKSALDFASKLVQSASSWTDKNSREVEGIEINEAGIPLAVGEEEPAPVFVVVQGTDVGPVANVAVDGIIPTNDDAVIAIDGGTKQHASSTQEDGGGQGEVEDATPPEGEMNMNQPAPLPEEATHSRSEESELLQPQVNELQSRDFAPLLSPPAPEKMSMRPARNGRVRPSPEQLPPVVFHQRSLQLDHPMHPAVEKQPIGRAESYGEDPVQNQKLAGSELGFYSSGTLSETDSSNHNFEEEGKETKEFFQSPDFRPSGYVSPVSDAHIPTPTDLDLQFSVSQNVKSPAESAADTAMDSSTGLRGFQALPKSFDGGERKRSRPPPLDSIGSDGLRVESMGSEGLRSPTTTLDLISQTTVEELHSPNTMEGLNSPTNTVQNTFSGSAFLDIDEPPEGSRELVDYKYPVGLLASSGMAAIGLLSAGGEIIPGSFPHPALENHKMTRKASGHLPDHPVTKRDLLDVIFEGAETLFCGAKPELGGTLPALPDDKWSIVETDEQEIGGTGFGPDVPPEKLSTPDIVEPELGGTSSVVAEDKLNTVEIIDIEALQLQELREETNAFREQPTSAPTASVEHKSETSLEKLETEETKEDPAPVRAPTGEHSVPAHELARAHLAFPDDIPLVLEESGQCPSDESSSEILTTSNNGQKRTGGTLPEDSEQGLLLSSGLAASSADKEKEPHVLETIDGAIEKEKQRYQSQGLLSNPDAQSSFETEEERLARVFGEDEDEEAQTNSNGDTKTPDKRPDPDTKTRAGNDETQVINETETDNAVLMKESKPALDPEAERHSGDESTAATTFASEEKTITVTEGVESNKEREARSLNTDVENILSNPHFAAAMESYCLANNIPNPITTAVAAGATSPSAQSRDPPTEEEGELRTIIEKSSGVQRSALDPPLMDENNQSYGEQLAQQGSLIEATHEAVEVMVDEFDEDEEGEDDMDDLRSLQDEAHGSSSLEGTTKVTKGLVKIASGDENSLLAPSGSVSEQNSKQGQTESRSAQESTSTKQEQHASIAVQNTGVPSNAGQMIVALESGLQDLCTYPIDQMCPGNNNGQDQRGPPSSILLPATGAGNKSVENSNGSNSVGNSNASTTASQNPQGDDASLAVSGSDVDPVLSAIGTYSKTKTDGGSEGDDDNLLFALTRSDLGSDTASRGSRSSKKTDFSSDESEREKQRLMSRVERVRALLDSNGQQNREMGIPESLSLPSSTDAVPGAITVGGNSDKSTSRSVLERLRQRRDLKQATSSSDPSSSTRDKTPEDLFARYDSIVKHMVVSDKKGRNVDSTSTKVINLSTSKSNELGTQDNYGSLIDDESSSARSSVRSKYSLPSQKSQQSQKSEQSPKSQPSQKSTPSEKARDLRKQLDQALKTSAEIRNTQELLNTEMSTFKSKLQRQRNAALNEVEALTANISPRASRSPVRGHMPDNAFTTVSPRSTDSSHSPLRAQDLEYLRTGAIAAAMASPDEFLHDGVVTSGSSETGGSRGSETDEDDEFRLQQLDSIIHGLRDAQQRRQATS